MRLIECYIKGFGKIKNKHIVFNNNIISINEPNGYGKSTIAEFITSMFYGLPKSSVKNFTREHYTPFNNNEFKGSLLFSVGNDIYKIERTFAKKEKDDTCVIYKNDILINIDNVGEYFFGIDLQSYKRLMFINSSDLELSTTTNINAKISGLIENSSDDVLVDEVIKRLEDRKKEIEPSRSKDSNGKLSQTKNKIKELTNELNNLNNIDKNLGDKYKTLNKLKINRDELRNKLNEAITYNEKVVIKDNINKYNIELNENKVELDKLLQDYPNGIVDIDTIKTIDSLNNQYNNLIIKRDNFIFNDIDEYYDLNTRFYNNIINKDIILTLENDLIEYNKLNNSSLESLTKEEVTLVEKYNDYSIDIDNKVHKLYCEYKDLSNTYNTISDYIVVDNNISNKSSFILLIISIITMLTGVLFTIFSNKYFIVLILVGFITLLVSGFIYLLKRTKNINVSKPNNYKLELKTKLDDLALNINSILSKYINIHNDVFVNITLLDEDIMRLNNILIRKNNIECNNKYRLDNINKLKDSITNTLLRYNINEIDINYGFNKLNNYYNRYLVLVDKKSKYDSEIFVLNNNINTIKEKLNIYINKYNISNISEFITKCCNDNIIINNLNNNIVKLEKDIKNELIKGDFDNLDEYNERIDVHKLTLDLNDIAGQIKIIANAIDNDELLVSKIDDISSEIDELNNFKLELENKVYLLSKAIDVIKDADNNLKNRYINPIKDRFIFYIKELEEILGEKIIINSNFELMFVRDGINRSYKYLSSGELTLVSLCYRLAIMDNIYDDYFLLLDDPFTLLDENHLNKALNLLKNISNYHQIIYLTCHNSRDIN